MSGLKFRIAGIPVRVEPLFGLVAILLAGSGRPGILVAWFVVIVFVSVLFHELAHAVMFRAFGRTPSIVLHGFGGLTSAPGAALSHGRDVLVSAAGPLSQILVLGIPALALRLPIARAFQSITWYEVMTDIAWVNLGWGVLNLVPILPLDGGRILAGALGRNRHGMRIARWTSIVVAAAGGAWAVTQGRYFLAMWGAMFAAINARGLTEEKQEPFYAKIREGHRLVDSGDPAAARSLAAELLATPADAAVHALASELDAWAALGAGDLDGAHAAAARIPPGWERSPYLAGVMVLAAGDRDAAAVILARAFAADAAGPPNTVTAASLASANLIEDVTRLIASVSGDDGRALETLHRALSRAGPFPETTR